MNENVLVLRKAFRLVFFVGGIKWLKDKKDFNISKFESTREVSLSVRINILLYRH